MEPEAQLWPIPRAEPAVHFCPRFAADPNSGPEARGRPTIATVTLLRVADRHPDSTFDFLLCVYRI